MKTIKIQLNKSQLVNLLDNDADFRVQFVEMVLAKNEETESHEIEFLAEKLAGYHKQNGENKIAAIKQLRQISTTVEIPSKYNLNEFVVDGESKAILGLAQAKHLIEKYW